MLSLSMWVALLGAFAVAVVSPGPDFLLVLRTSLQFGRRHGFATAAGIALGTAVWIITTMVGLAAFIRVYPWLEFFTRLAGSVLLLYLSVRILWGIWRERGQQPTVTGEIPPIFSPEGVSPASRSVGTSLWLGLATTTVGNPKAVIFFSSLFASMLPPGLTFLEGFTLGTLMVLTSFSWFILISSVASNPTFRSGYQRIKTPVDIFLGTLFIALAVALLS